MKLKYTVDESADEPIILVNKHIGKDDDEGEGILGDQFQNELMYLDTLGKKRIKVYICSPGGDVMDAMKMYNAILATKTKVDTYNGGVAASAAGFVFQAGRTRYMSDYALLMMHNPMGPEDSGSTTLNAFKDSIVKMLTRKSSASESKISDMMNNTTWLNAEQCMAEGLCDVIESSADMNKPRAVNAPTDARATWKNYCTYFNSINKPQPQNTMKKVTNFLKLNDSANEESIVSAIEAIQNNAVKEKEAKEKAEGDLVTAKADLEAANKKVTDLTNSLKEKTDKEAADVITAKEAAAELAVQNLAKDGKIKNDADTITKVKNQFVKDYAGTKEIYDAMPINKKGAVITNLDEKDKEGKVIVKNTMASVMAQIAEKNKQN